MNRLETEQQALSHLYEDNLVFLQQTGTILVAKLPLIATVAFVPLLLVPSLQQVGALGMRASTLYSAGAVTWLDWNDANDIQKALNITKIGTVVLGIIGLAVGSTACMVTGIILDTALQCVNVAEMAFILSRQNLSKRELQIVLCKLIPNIMTLAVNSLIISSLCLGSAELIIAGTILSMVTMCAISSSKGANLAEPSPEVDCLEKVDNVLDIILYGVLSIFFLALAVEYDPDPSIPRKVSLKIHDHNWNQIRNAANQTSTSFDYYKNCRYRDLILKTQEEERVSTLDLAQSHLYGTPLLFT